MDFVVSSTSLNLKSLSLGNDGDKGHDNDDDNVKVNEETIQNTLNDDQNMFEKYLPNELFNHMMLFLY